MIKTDSVLISEHSLGYVIVALRSSPAGKKIPRANLGPAAEVPVTALLQMGSAAVKLRERELEDQAGDADNQAEHRDRPPVAGGVRGPVLRDELDLGVVVGPRVHPPDQPVEAMVVGADGDEHGPTVAAHSSGPITTLPR